MLPPSRSDRVQPCVWMSAGLLTYKLCDRDFDCEHCPLDEALGGRASHASRHAELMLPSEVARSFPDDRLYSLGHAWLQSAGAGVGPRFRFGLDAFAATMIGHCISVFCPATDSGRVRGEVLCEIDIGLGVLLVTAPIDTVRVVRNDRLEQDPNQLVTAPYGDGWIADVQARDISQLHRLLTAQAARDWAHLDLRRFRRQVALQLLANDTQGLGACLCDGGELADFRQMLAGPAYLNLIRELIH